MFEGLLARKWSVFKGLLALRHARTSTESAHRGFAERAKGLAAASETPLPPSFPLSHPPLCRSSTTSRMMTFKRRRIRTKPSTGGPGATGTRMTSATNFQSSSSKSYNGNLLLLLPNDIFGVVAAGTPNRWR